MSAARSTPTLLREWQQLRRPRRRWPLKHLLALERLVGSNMSLYKNIHAKRKRIASGSGETMRKPGSKGAPTAKAFKQAKKTAKKK